MQSSEDSFQLLADGLALVYHEARHVRHLVKPAILAMEGWERLMSLPTNRVEAWKVIQPLRKEAATALSAPVAEGIFRRRFLKDLDELKTLYADPHWKHASSVGGHAWRGVAQAVSDLAEALDGANPLAIAAASRALVEARHNNGSIREKIADLDEAITVTTHRAWLEHPTGA